MTDTLETTTRAGGEPLPPRAVRLSADARVAGATERGRDLLTPKLSHEEALDELEAALHAALSLGDAEAALRISSEIDAIPAPPAVPILSAALWYAQHGLHVIPLTPRSKIPHKGTRGSHDATTDEATIRAWWERWPESNVGIATGYVVDVVDIDGYMGQVSRARHWRDMPEADEVLGSVLTPRPGGMHLYVAADPGMKNGAGILPGVDARAMGGYVVAPPSRTDVGVYRWLRPLKVGQ